MPPRAEAGVYDKRGLQRVGGFRKSPIPIDSCAQNAENARNLSKIMVDSPRFKKNRKTAGQQIGEFVSSPTVCPRRSRGSRDPAHCQRDGHIAA